MKQKLDLTTWNRKEHFLFFKQMDEPFYGITTTIDCTKAYTKAKAIGVSFFSYYLHKTLSAVNAVENFRYRIIEDEVYVFDVIDASATVMREDKTFGFSYMPFTSLSNARSFTWPDSCPKISIGKLMDENGKKSMPISVHVHHGLADGYHVGLFLEKLQQLMNE